MQVARAIPKKISGKLSDLPIIPAKDLLQEQTTNWKICRKYFIGLWSRLFSIPQTNCLKFFV
jgi:hypothetical protein